MSKIFRCLFSVPHLHYLLPFLHADGMCLKYIIRFIGCILFLLFPLYKFLHDSFDIFGTFFTSVKFSACCTLDFYHFDILFSLLCYQNDRKCQKCQLCHVIFFIPHSFFSNALFKNSALVVFSHS